LQVRDAVQRTESLLGPVDILVNNAGILYYTMMKNVNVEEWQQIVDVNVKGVLNCVGAVLGGMVERRQGHIVNISSDGGRKVDICTFFLSSNMFVTVLY
jgi:NADP-dependent 3-hydroxy acid dehydrogenase YdfG